MRKSRAILSRTSGNALLCKGWTSFSYAFGRLEIYGQSSRDLDFYYGKKPFGAASNRLLLDGDLRTAAHEFCKSEMEVFPPYKRRLARLLM